MRNSSTTPFPAAFYIANSIEIFERLAWYGMYLYQQSANILQNSEFKDFAGEDLGHGVGLQLHEQPFIGSACQTTIEQGLEILTKSPKHLIELKLSFGKYR